MQFRVKRQFGDESGTQITDADILNWLNEGQKEIARQTGVLQARLVTDSVADQSEYAIPTNFISIRRAAFNGKVLQTITLEELDTVSDTWKNQGSGYPQRFLVWGNTIVLYPAPSTDVDEALEIYYIKYPDVLETPTDIPEIPTHMHHELVRFALAQAKELDEEDSKSQAVKLEFDTQMAQIRYETNNRSIDSYGSVRLLPGDD